MITDPGGSGSGICSRSDHAEVVPGSASVAVVDDGRRTCTTVPHSLLVRSSARRQRRDGPPPVISVILFFFIRKWTPRTCPRSPGERCGSARAMVASPWPKTSSRGSARADPRCAGAPSKGCSRRWTPQCLLDHRDRLADWRPNAALCTRRDRRRGRYVEVLGSGCSLTSASLIRQHVHALRVPWRRPASNLDRGGTAVPTPRSRPPAGSPAARLTFGGRTSAGTVRSPPSRTRSSRFSSRCTTCREVRRASTAGSRPTGLYRSQVRVSTIPAAVDPCSCVQGGLPSASARGDRGRRRATDLHGLLPRFLRPCRSPASDVGRLVGTTSPRLLRDPQGWPGRPQHAGPTHRRGPATWRSCSARWLRPRRRYQPERSRPSGGEPSRRSDHGPSGLLRRCRRRASGSIRRPSR
jgi:hypothetical protein